MYLQKVYIRHRESYPDSHNTFSAWSGFKDLGVETVPFYGFGDIDALEDLGPEVGIVGFIGDVWDALKKIGKPRPEALDYPEELRPWLGREVRRTTLGEVRRSTDRVFLKPVSEKLFTGFIWKGPTAEASRVAPLEDPTPVWTSEIVSFVSEYRAYVKDDVLLGVKHYKGDWSVVPDRKVVEEAVKAYRSSPRGLSLDFGVTEDGKTLLVEANDGYGLGNYGLPNPLYSQLLEARWEELTR